MNKTISINIGGMVFQIDEEAYLILEQYLESLKKHFANTEGCDEIIQDIEARIAEIFQAKIETGQQLILKENVEEAITMLGKPGDIGEQNYNNSSQEQGGKTSKKRLYRDEENKVLGGVCSGLGHYLDIDPVWFRIAFLVSIFFAGTGVILYFVLWAIIPKAVTAEERMQMRGSPTTISEIEKKIKNEFEDLKNRFHEMKNSSKRRGRREMHELKRKIRQAKKDARYSYRQRSMASSIAGTQKEKNRNQGFGSVFGEILYYFVRFLLSFAGIVLLIIAIVLSISLVLSLTASDSFLFFTKWGISTFSLPVFSHLFFENAWQQQFVVITLILLIGVPLLMLIFNSIRMIIGFKHKSRIVSVTASLLWLSGLIMAIFITLNIVGSFSEKSNMKEEVFLPQPDKVFYVDVSDNLPDISDTYYYHEDESEDVIHNPHPDMIFKNCFISGQGDKMLVYGLPKLKIIPSKTNQYKLTIVKISRGSNLIAARERAESVKMGVKVIDSLLIIDNYFLLPEQAKWRNQSVKLILEVPEGKNIFLSKNLNKLAYNNEFMDGSWDFDLTGKILTMHNGRLIISSDLPMVNDSTSKSGI